MELFIPGRLCLFGEHSDWTSLYQKDNLNIPNGQALLLLLQQGIHAKISKSQDIHITSTVGQDLNKLIYHLDCEADISSLKPLVTSSTFFSYAASVCLYMITHYDTGGITINNDITTLPVKKGLASSASFSLLCVKAYNMVYNLKLSIEKQTSIAFQCELQTGSHCGKMDFSSAYDYPLLLTTFNNENVTFSKIKHSKPIYLVLVDLLGEKDTKKILNDLQIAYPFPNNKNEKDLHYFLGKGNQIYVKKAISCIKKGNALALGQLMNAHQKDFDKFVTPFSHEQLRSVILHKLLGDKTIINYTYGGKGVGSHGDGSAQFIAKNYESQQYLLQYLSHLGYGCYEIIIKKD
ncbi:MAG: hypothetical protein KAG94_03475 [Clostridiales bacterium]|nr:hypothetical protein [Clostridiales bacterium]